MPTSRRDRLSPTGCSVHKGAGEFDPAARLRELVGDELDVAALRSAEGDRERGKPNPGLYLEALASLGLRPPQAVALEDSANGIAAAKAAGLACIAVPNAVTRGAARLEAADRLLGSLVEVDLDDLPQAPQPTAR